MKTTSNNNFVKRIAVDILSSAPSLLKLGCPFRKDVAISQMNFSVPMQNSISMLPSGDFKVETKSMIEPDKYEYEMSTLSFSNKNSFADQKLRN